MNFFRDTIEITNCTNSGSIIQSQNGIGDDVKIGGILAWYLDDDTGTYNIKISECTNKGNINIANVSKDSQIAGIASLDPNFLGWANPKLTLSITDSINEAAINVNFDNASDPYSDTNSRVAGIAVQNSYFKGGDIVTLERCTNKGALSGNPMQIAGIYLRK